MPLFPGDTITDIDKYQYNSYNISGIAHQRRPTTRDHFFGLTIINASTFKLM
jgi:hypothetical protein